MTKDKIIKLMKLLGSKPKPVQDRAGWFVCSCPMAAWSHDGGKDKDPSFAVRIEPNMPFANCFSCGWHGDVGKLFHEMRHNQKRDPQVAVYWRAAWEVIEETDGNFEIDLSGPTYAEQIAAGPKLPHYFPEWWLTSYPPWSAYDWSTDYILKERGVPQAVANLLDIRADSKEGRLCFPVRDFEGKLVGFHGRAVSKETQPRYKMYLQGGHNNPDFWLGENWVDFGKPIVVVEGPFDVASIYRVYRNVVSPLFVNPSVTKLHRMGDAFKWITMYDRGAGGNAGRTKVESVMGGKHIVHHLQPPEGRKDPGVMTTQECVDALKDLVPLDEIIA